MNVLHFFLFLFGLLALIVLGHDIYVAYMRAEEDIYMIPETLRLSDLGWLWVQYEPESYDTVHDSINPALWEGTIVWILEQTALYVALVPFVVLGLYALIARLIGLPPYKDLASSTLFHKGKAGKHDSGSTGSAVKYKRK